MKYFALILVCLLGWRTQAAEVMPPAPEHYFNDYAHVISSATASQLDQELENFERQTSEQIVVALYPTMQSDSSIEDYTVRVARAWKVGQKDKNNGAVLFIFVQDHKMFLQTGYGMEGVLPDALCKDIISDEIAPRFKAGDFDGGVTAGVQAIMAAAHGEYKGTGRTVAGNHVNNLLPLIIFIIIIAFIVFARGGRGIIFTGGGWSGGGGGWGGGSGGGGGGGFSGGGGSFGGGGAGGSW